MSPLFSSPPDRLTCDAQGEVLAATGLAKGIVGTAGVEATMLRAGRPEGQIPLLATDCVGALIIGEGGPISEPLVGRPVMGIGVISRQKWIRLKSLTEHSSLQVEERGPEEGSHSAGTEAERWQVCLFLESRVFPHSAHLLQPLEAAGHT